MQTEADIKLQELRARLAAHAADRTFNRKVLTFSLIVLAAVALYSVLLGCSSSTGPDKQPCASGNFGWLTISNVGDNPLTVEVVGFQFIKVAPGATVKTQIPSGTYRLNATWFWCTIFRNCGIYSDDETITNCQTSTARFETSRPQ